LCYTATDIVTLKQVSGYTEMHRQKNIKIKLPTKHIGFKYEFKFGKKRRKLQA